MGEGDFKESKGDGVFSQGKENGVKTRGMRTVGYVAASKAQHSRVVGAASKANDPIVGLESLK